MVWVFAACCSLDAHPEQFEDSSKACSELLSSLDRANLSSTFWQWVYRVGESVGRALTGPIHIPSEELSPAKEDIVYFHLLPHRAKTLRKRFTAQEVNDIFSELLIRLTVELSRSGVSVQHRGIWTEYKSLRMSIESGTLQPEVVDGAIERALRGFEESLAKHKPRVFEILKSHHSQWIEYGVGKTELEAKVHSELGTRGKKDRRSIQRMARASLQSLHQLVRELPKDFDQLPSAHLFTSQLNGVRTLNFEVFELLRNSENAEELRERLTKGLQWAPNVDEREKMQIEKIVDKLWKMRELLKVFTPPNEWNAEDVTPFDAQQSSKVLSADRLLSIDLKGVGARLFQEIAFNLASIAEDRASTRELMNAISIKQTVMWLKTSIRSVLQRSQATLGERYITHVWVGDELNIYYRGASILDGLEEHLSPSVRVMDLDLQRQLTAEQSERLNIYTQSSLNQFAESFSKIVEQNVLAYLEPAPSLRLRLALRPGSATRILLLIEIHNAPSLQTQKIRETILASVSEEALSRDESFNYWWGRTDLEVHIQGAIEDSSMPVLSASPSGQ